MAAMQDLVVHANKVIAFENEALRSNDLANIAASTSEKVGIVAALSRLLAASPAREADLETRSKLKDLLAELKENERLLQIQLQAANHAAETFAQAIRNVEADGTYSKY